jgi:hypothetical protein
VVALGITITSTEVAAARFKMPVGNKNTGARRDLIYQATLMVVAALLMAITLLAPSGD